MENNQKIYFISDFHLGVPNHKESREREDLIVKWLDEIKSDAAELYLLGDIFDFWFEYKTVIPKGFVRFQGKLAELSDSGITIHFITGNHDLWMKDYFLEEFNIPVYFNPITVELSGKRFYLGHGDGLGPEKFGAKFINKLFKNSIAQWTFSLIHPSIGVRLGQYFSKKSRYADSNESFKGEDGEFLIIFAKQMLQREHYDFFIFGHRHIPTDLKLNENSRYINLGDWINNCTYAVFDGTNLELKKFKKDN